jgi:hypothetical protein
MRRFLTHYESHERTKHMQVLSTRLSKFLKQRERKNRKDFIFATEFERVMWTNVTEKYDKKTKIFAIDFIVQLHGYFESIMTKFANVSPKLMLQVASCDPLKETDSKLCVEIESNDSDLLSTYLEIFHPHSGVKKRKSLFAGKMLTIKNNLILDGKKINDGF